MLSSALLLASVLAFLPPPASPSDQGDILRGPDVPQDALKADRQRKVADDKAKAMDKEMDKPSKPMLEQRVLFMTVEKLELDDATRAKVRSFQDEFAASVVAYEKSSATKRKELAESRKNAPAGKPSEEYRKAMDEMEAARPKVAALRERMEGVMSKEQITALRTGYDENLKRARAELTKRNEEARKAQEAAGKSDAAKKGGDQAKKDKSKDKSGGQKKEKEMPAPDAPNEAPPEMEKPS